MRKVSVQYIIWGGIIISFITLMSVMLGVATLTTALQFGISALGAFICIALLKQLYLEHEAYYYQEQKLKADLIEYICQHYADLPEKIVIEKYIDQALAGQSSSSARMRSLKLFRKDSSALDAFLEILREQYNEIAVLKSLGLRWGNSH